MLIRLIGMPLIVGYSNSPAACLRAWLMLSTETSNLLLPPEKYDERIVFFFAPACFHECDSKDSPRRVRHPITVASSSYSKKIYQGRLHLSNFVALGEQPLSHQNGRECMMKLSNG